MQRIGGCEGLTERTKHRLFSRVNVPQDFVYIFSHDIILSSMNQHLYSSLRNPNYSVLSIVELAGNTVKTLSLTIIYHIILDL